MGTMSSLVQPDSIDDTRQEAQDDTDNNNGSGYAYGLSKFCFGSCCIYAIIAPEVSNACRRKKIGDSKPKCAEQ
jgi:hypothetical protein